jgi:hypothetical protein
MTHPSQALRQALELALDAMNYMGDILNGMDAVDEADEARTAPAFDAVRAAIAGRAIPREPSDWRIAAANFLRGEAEDQQATNAQYPDHAKAYPSWVQRIDWAIRMAEKLEQLASASPYGIEPWATTEPDALSEHLYGAGQKEGGA